MSRKFKTRRQIAYEKSSFKDWGEAHERAGAGEEGWEPQGVFFAFSPFPVINPAAKAIAYTSALPLWS